MIMQRATARYDSSLVPKVMALWDQKLNTAEIAKQLHEPEHDIAFALHVGREARRRSK